MCMDKYSYIHVHTNSCRGITTSFSEISSSSAHTVSISAISHAVWTSISTKIGRRDCSYRMRFFVSIATVSTMLPICACVWVWMRVCVRVFTYVRVRVLIFRYLCYRSNHAAHLCVFCVSVSIAVCVAECVAVCGTVGSDLFSHQNTALQCVLQCVL